MKKVGIGAGILLILLIGSALIVPGFIDWNKYKQEIVEQASDLSGRKVMINGDLSLAIIPSPSFSAADVSVSNVEGGQAQNFISLKSVDVNVALFPLLKGEVQVKKFILVEPVIALEVAEDGTGNWEFGSATAEDQSGGSQTDLSLERFQIENGQVSYQDLATGQKELLRNINASVTMDSLNGPFTIDGDVKYKNLPIQADVKVGTIREGRKIPVNVNAGFLDNDVRFVFSGGVTQDKNGTLADGKINLDTDDIGNLPHVLAMLDAENSNQTLTPYNMPLSMESTLFYGGDAVNISALDFEMGESRGNAKAMISLSEKIKIDGEMNINSFDLDKVLQSNSNVASNEPKETQATNSEADLSFIEKLEGNFVFKLGALRFNEKIANQLDMEFTAGDGQIHLNEAKLKMPGGSDFNMNGTLSANDNNLEFLGNTEVNSGNLRAFLDWLKVDTSTIPTGRLTRLSYKGAVRATPDMVQLYAMNGGLDTFTFTGGVSVALQERPSFGLDMDIKNLNVDNYLDPNNDEPLDLKEALAIFADFDANYKLNMSDLTVSAIKIGRINLAGNLLDGNLDNNFFRVQNYAGFNATGAFTGRRLASDPSFVIKTEVSTPSLVPLQRAYRFETPYDLNKIGAVSANANITGNFEKIDIDIKSTVGKSKADIKGQVRSATLKQLPEVGSFDVAVNASNESLLDLINQFDLPIENLANADDKPVSVNGSFKGNLKLVDVDSNVSVAGGDVMLKGRYNTDENDHNTYDMAVDVNAQDIKEFIRGLGVEFDPMNRELGSLKIAMTASGTDESISLKNISGNVGPTKLNGSGEITALNADKDAGEKTGFDFNLVLDDIPVQEFMQAEAAEPQENDWGNWSEDPLELDAMNGFEGRAVITANNITYDKYNFENPRFEAVLSDGKININNFSGKLFGGEAVLAGSFSSLGELDMDLSLKNADLTQATTSFAGIKPITGYFDMTQKITAKGTSQRALVSSLNGDGEVVASPGIVNGINIPELSNRLKELSNQNGLLSLIKTTLSGGETPYDGGNSIITVKNGFIQFNPFDVNLAGASSNVNLAINLSEWNLNMGGNMALSDHPEAPPIGINIVGDLHDPQINYDTKQLQGYVGAKIAANLIQNMVSGDGGGLGGLFGLNRQRPNNTANVDTNNSGQIEQQPIDQSANDWSNPGAIEQQEIPPQQAQANEQQPAEQQPAQQQDRGAQSVEELGTRLLERLFNKPPKNNN